MTLRLSNLVDIILIDIQHRKEKKFFIAGIKLRTGKRGQAEKGSRKAEKWPAPHFLGAMQRVLSKGVILVFVLSKGVILVFGWQPVDKKWQFV